MRSVVTGGAGFIGRWVVKRLLDDGQSVVVLDDLSNGSEENLADLLCDRLQVVVGSIAQTRDVERAFAGGADLCLHLAARIVVQDSIDDPVGTYEPDTVGTLHVLEAARRCNARFLFVSSCMVYDLCGTDSGIDESHATVPLSPYAASKLSGEALTLSYAHTYGLRAAIVRPFNTYGPHQKSTGEGGVVPLFCRATLEGEPIRIYGDGAQTRDLLYVEDCAAFLVLAAQSDACVGRVLNAGLGTDVSVNDLARLVCNRPDRIEHVEHIHPQCEIPRLLCDNSLARNLLNWQPVIGLEEGVRRTTKWLEGRILCA